ncbi:hypothetical protein TYRP_010439 [Tyrophagus putrescentiae]|nr:hypothetical protein TYRP_010439 [Tyrophagus putrescentiae]
MIVTSAASDQHSSFRSRIESAKADLKRMFSVDVCQQMDVLFAEVLHDLELAAYSGGSSGSSAGVPSSSLSSSSSSSQEPLTTTSYSEEDSVCPTDHLLPPTCYPPSSSSEEHEDVLTPLVKAASSAEQPVLSGLPPNDEPVQLENCSVVSCCSQELAEEEEEEDEKEEKLEKEDNSEKCPEKCLKNYVVAEKEEHDHQDDVESSEPAFDQLTALNSRSLSSSNGKHHHHHHQQQQFKKLHIESDEVVCPIVWCGHVTYKRHQFILHFQLAHPEVSALSCALCDTVLYRPWDMFMHELLYHLSGLFGCTAAGCAFVGGTRAAVLAHYDTLHLERAAPRRPRSLPPTVSSAQSHYRARLGRLEPENGGSFYNNNNSSSSSSSSKALVSYVDKRPQWRRRPLINPMKLDQWRSKANSNGCCSQYSRPTASMYTATTSSSSSSSVASYYDGAQADSQPSMPPPPPPLPPQAYFLGTSAYKLSYCSGDQSSYHNNNRRQQQQQQLTYDGGDGFSGGYQQQQQQQMYPTSQQLLPSYMLPTTDAAAAAAAASQHHNFFL